MADRPFFSDCISWPATCKEAISSDGMSALHHLIENGENISLEQFRNSISEHDWEDLIRTLGYAPEGENGLRIEEDYHVAFRHDPESGVIFAVHSAIEYVFATPEEVAEIEERCLQCDLVPEELPEALVLVHAGSLCGSARMQLGRPEADAARAEILDEVASHEGPLVIIDGSMSDEISPHENTLMEAALARNAEAGHLSLRMWGCDEGVGPYPEWTPFGGSREGLSFGGQVEAAEAVAPRLADNAITVTGAWATEDLSSGCASSVVTALRAALGPGAIIEHSPCVLYEPEEELEESLSGECEKDSPGEP